MPEAPKLDIDYVARLARLDLTPEEKRSFAAQLGDVLRHIDNLSAVDVTGVEPTAHAFPVENVWDPDEPRTGLSVADALRNAPAQRENMVSVPKVIE
jgi:aspartyl-tRNA(Asn)/glutamyl-tRNA(Gln) amidotransferase subunit C